MRVYLEEGCASSLEKHPAVAFGDFRILGLLGREYHLGEERLILVRATVEAAQSQGPQGERSLPVGPDMLHALEAEQKRQFPKLKLVGWAVNQPGYGTDGAWRFEELGDTLFSSMPLFLLLDGRTHAMTFYERQADRYVPLSDYHLYREETEGTSLTEQLQDNDEVTAEPLGLPEEREVERASLLPEEGALLPGSGTSLRMLTSLASVLLLVCLVMGMLLFNNTSTLDGIWDKLEVLGQQMEQLSGAAE